MKNNISDISQFLDELEIKYGQCLMDVPMLALQSILDDGDLDQLNKIIEGS